MTGNSIISGGGALDLSAQQVDSKSITWTLDQLQDNYVDKKFMLCNQKMGQVLEAFQHGACLFAKLSCPQQTKLGGKLLGRTHLKFQQLNWDHCIALPGPGQAEKKRYYDQQLFQKWT